MDTSHSAKKPIRYWPLWIPRVILLIYILGLFLYTVIDYTFIKELSPRFWDFGPSIGQMITMAILLLIAWFKPIIGGILIICTGIIILISAGFALLAAFSEGAFGGFWLIPWGIILPIPGALFLVFGRIREKAQND